jgi:4-diphosphocytidyl-2-C-methyl-D-erythritol kinase
MPAPSDPVVGVEAPAKLNLALAVVGRREDGYHDLRTVFQAVDLADDLVLAPGGNGIELTVEGEVSVDGGPSNLAVRAAALLARRHAPGRGARIRLRKRIPVGAGLGGGSSDAAAVLLGLERLWDLALSRPEREALALELGSDVPFFLRGGTARGEGRGERLTPLPDVPCSAFVLAVPALSLSTRDVFAALREGEATGGPGVEAAERAVREGDCAALGRNLVNDLEAPATRVAPALAGWRRALEARGAPAVGLSGSGAAYFVPFSGEDEARRFVEDGPVPPGLRLLLVRPRPHGARLRLGPNPLAPGGGTG